MATRLTLQLPAGEFSYLESGQGDPIVFLHALGRDATDWLRVLEAMHSRWRCIALDQRGHGESVWPGEYSFDLLEDDLRAFADSLELERFVLVAHSMGGTVGWLFAERTPQRLEALIIEDTPVPTGRQSYPEPPDSPPEPVSYDWKARRQLFQQLNSPDPSWWASLPEVRTWTLLIAGGTSDQELDRTASTLPHSELVSIPVGHWIHESEPERFVEAIQSFLVS